MYRAAKRLHVTFLSAQPELCWYCRLAASFAHKKKHANKNKLAAEHHSGRGGGESSGRICFWGKLRAGGPSCFFGAWLAQLSFFRVPPWGWKTPKQMRNYQRIKIQNQRKNVPCFREAERSFCQLWGSRRLSRTFLLSSCTTAGGTCRISGKHSSAHFCIK